MTAEIHNTKVNLSGLLEVLGKNLYSTPFVALRELVQNAHDACVRRSIEDKADFQAKIHIQIKKSEKQIIITDNGAGLTHSEIIEHLATIGSGYTRLLRNQTQTEDMIGYFGLGFLTAYVLADKVEMISSSYQEPEQGWHFISSGGQRYSVEECAPREIGSQIKLYLNSEYHTLLDVSLLEVLIRKYCGLLSIPIYLNSQEHAINDLQAPWKLSAEVSPLKRKKQYLEFAQIFEPHYEVLAALPIKATDELQVEGVMWIQGGGTYATSDQRNVNVYIRGMQISDQLRELLPNWAGFVGCMFDSPDLVPTASREDLQKDQAYERLKEHLRASLISGLERIAHEETASWQRIISRHNEALMGAAIADDRLFQVLYQDIKLPTSDGDLSVETILTRSDGTLRLALEEHGGYEEIMCRALMIPVISGYRYGAMSFSRLYSDSKGVPLAILGTKKGNDSLFHITESNADETETLAKLLCGKDEKIIPAHFEPNYMPLIVVPDEEVMLKRRMENDEMDKKVSKAVLGLARTYTQEITKETLANVYVNLASPLIKRLLELPAEPQKQFAKLLRSFINLLSNKQHDNNTTMAHELQAYHDSLLSFMGETP